MRNKSNRLEELFLGMTVGQAIHEIALAWIAFQTIVTRESRRRFGVWRQSFLPAIVTSILYFVIFGQVIGSRIGEMARFSICTIYRAWFDYDADHL